MGIYGSHSSSFYTSDRNFLYQIWQQRLDEDRQKRLEEDAEYRKKRIAQELAFSATSASALKASYDSIFGKDNIPKDLEAHCNDLMKADAKKLSRDEIAQLDLNDSNALISAIRNYAQELGLNPSSNRSIEEMAAMHPRHIALA